MLFIYYGFYDIGWTPLPCEFTRSLNVQLDVLTLRRTVAYGAEILPYHMRLKGLSIMLSVQSVAQAFVRQVPAITVKLLALDSKTDSCDYHATEPMGQPCCPVFHFVEIVSKE